MEIDCSLHRDCKTVKELMDKLEVDSSSYLAVKNGTLCPKDEPISAADCVEFIKATYGG
ncbi:MAG: MoaD/ThiS family protein [Candidatus Altiarchaeota archaeon]